MDASTIVVSVFLLFVLGLVARAIIHDWREDRAEEQASQDAQDSAAVCEPGGSHLSTKEE